MTKRSNVTEMAKVVSSWLRKESEENRDKFLSSSREELIVYHTTLGRKIRNHFKLFLRKHEPVIKNGIDISRDHPDAISMRVIEKVWLDNQKT